MNDDDDSDFEDRDDIEDTDPIVRELRIEICRLEAQIDQLSASMRERAAETVVIRAQIAMLEERLALLEARQRRYLLLVRIAWVLMLFSMCLSLYTYFSQ
jgi:septal ring factor EnvC (AmiA/AmiB activator)